MIDLNWLSYKLVYLDGYGRYSLHTVRALAQTGKVNVRPDLVDRLDLPGWVQRMMGLDFTNLTVSIMPGHELRALPGRQWAYSMYESTRLPDGWSDSINTKTERLIVPCEWCEDVFRDNGVTVPIHVVYGGTDPEENPVIPAFPNSNRPYTFITLGDRGSRKGWDTTWAAFCQAFTPKDDVRLIVKCRGFDLRFIDNTNSPDPMTKKIHIWREDVDRMHDVFAHADCAVYPARSDGWGMWCREAACCGLPVIATNYSGVAVGIEHWAYPVGYREVDAQLPSPKAPGKWATANVEEVAHWMRYCYENRETAKQKGLQAAQWIRDNQTWQHSAAQMIDLLERYA